MNDQELQRLMNDQLDGVLSPEESERLTRFLQSSEKAQAQYQKLGQVFTALSRPPLEEPPPDLKQNVLRQIRLRSAAAPARITPPCLVSHAGNPQHSVTFCQATARPPRNVA